MTREESEAQLRETAEGAVEVALADLRSEAEDTDFSWLPDDFANRLLEIAWSHQFDVDKTRFRRAVKEYLSAAVEEVS